MKSVLIERSKISTNYLKDDQDNMENDTIALFNIVLDTYTKGLNLRCNKGKLM